MRLRLSKFIYPSAIFSLVLFTYLLFAGRFQFEFPVTIYNYFSFLAEAFLHRSLSFISNPPYLQDLSVFNGKIYMYWGPTTVLPILPFVILFGKNISDVLYTAIIASFNPLIFYLILGQLEKIRFIKLLNYQKILLSLFLAFGTVHFYLSTSGTVWFTSQVISILFLLLAILFTVTFVNSKNKIKLILASLFFGFAVVAREILIFDAPIFLAFLLILHLQTKRKSQLVQNLMIFALVFSFILGLNFYYNYLRFESFFDNGHSRHNFAQHFAADLEKFGEFNPVYISKKFYYMFVNIPPLTQKLPYFAFDKEGNSFLFISPLFFSLIVLVRKKYWQSLNHKLINGSIIVSSLLIIFLLLNYFSTGWVQFGYRYILDVTPGFMILLTTIIDDMPPSLTIGLFLVSVIINLLGTLWFIYI